MDESGPSAHSNAQLANDPSELEEDAFLSLPAINFTTDQEEEFEGKSTWSIFSKRFIASKKKAKSTDNKMTKGISSRFASALPGRLKKKQVKGGLPYGSRAITGSSTLQAKAKVLKDFEGLEIERPQLGDRAAQIVMCGANSIRAEVIDLNSMVVTMSENITMLTHTAVERFFSWFPPFLTYIDRYLIIEEDFIIRPIEEKIDGLKGQLKPSARMFLRGRIQRCMNDLADLQGIFTPSLPAGQKLPDVKNACAEFTKCIVEYWSLVTMLLPPLIREHFSKNEADKLRTRLVKHVVNHVGYKDFLAIYTRWMGNRELLEWKKNVLLPTDYKFFSYSSWDRDMEQAHYFIAAQFGEILLNENAEDIRLREESKADFERARATRLQMEEAMADELGIYSGDDYDLESEGVTPRTPRLWSPRAKSPGRKTPRSAKSPRSARSPRSVKSPVSPGSPRNRTSGGMAGSAPPV